MTIELVLDQTDGPIGRLTLNDPGHANVLSQAMMTALSDALARLVADPEVRVIVLAADGRIFSAGHDLGELVADDDRSCARRPVPPVRRADAGHCRLPPKPVIARVQGAAVAAGTQLGRRSCDLAFAAEGARFAVSGIDLGLFCSTPSVALSRMRAAARSTLEMLLTGRFVSAHRSRSGSA